MNNAIYAATTGMLNRSRALDVTASNLANVNTAGYKRDRLITSAFGEQVAYRLEAGSDEVIGSSTHGSIANEVFTDYSQGVVDNTGRALDFAIVGDGFFSIETANGQQASTRDGSFQVDQEGYLRTSTGGYVLGQGGRMQVGVGAVSIDPNGVVTSDGQTVDTLAILVPDPANNNQTKQSLNALSQPTGQGTFTGRIASGKLERSNVDVGEEMAAMMAASRAFQTCAQAVKILDAITQKSVNEIGRV